MRRFTSRSVRWLASQALDRFDYKIETANINSSILTDVEQ
jgi:hypothetical protein